MLQNLQGLGQEVIQWDLVTRDPDPKVSATDILSEVRRGTRHGSIIMLANGRGHHTAQAQPEIIELLRDRGFELVTISELLGDVSP